MASRKSAEQYMNIMAMGLKIVDTISITPFNQIFALKKYEKISNLVETKMDSYWCNDDNLFLAKIKSFFLSIEENTDKDCKQIMAFAFCQWLDLKITYMKNEYNPQGNRIYFSLSNLVPLTSNNPVTLNSLNTNYQETGIWINPKFPIASPHITRNEKNIVKPVCNRDIFEGINGSLTNCSYILYDDKKIVKNIILSNSFLNNQKQQVLSIAFSPMSDKSDLIQTEDQLIKRDGNEFNGEAVKPLTELQAQELLERFKNDWTLAGDINADIFFAPELLGTSLSEKNDGIYNTLIFEYSSQRLFQRKNVPILTILPSYWVDNCNSSTIVNQDGEILAKQEKHIPFVDKNANKMEALAEKATWETILIHIPNVHRIAIVICAEFLSDQERIKKFICGSLGATLIIVPSYSRGEQDFINTLPILKCYGTTIVWGNCCGAVSSASKAIGGCGIAGTTQTAILGSQCKCNFTCKNIKACVFKIAIPLDFELTKTKDHVQTATIIHETR